MVAKWFNNWLSKNDDNSELAKKTAKVFARYNMPG